MESKLDLAQKALKYLELAERFEESKDWPNALQNYEIGAETLKSSGYLTERMEDLHVRINRIKKMLETSTTVQRVQYQDERIQLESHGYALLEEAKKLEANGLIDDSIKQYMSAISSFIRAGWQESQVDTIKTKIISLADVIDQRNQRHDIVPAPQPMVPRQSSSDPRMTAKTMFEEIKRSEEEIQTQAFSILDDAKKLEDEKKFDEAIYNYTKAIELLNSIGWVNQTKNIQLTINKIKQNKVAFENFQTQQGPIPSEFHVESSPTSSSEADSRSIRIKEYEDKRKREGDIEQRAFKLIDEGKRMEKASQFDEATQSFLQAIELLKSIGWDSYIQPIIAIIDQIKLKHQREIRASEIRINKQAELEKIQEPIQENEKEQLIQASIEKELRRIGYEKEMGLEQQNLYNQLTTKRECGGEIKEIAFKLLDEGKKFAYHYDFLKAYSYFESAIIKLKEIGWDKEIKYIQAEINNTKILEERYKNKKKEEIDSQKNIERHKTLEEIRISEEEKKKGLIIGEVGARSNEIAKMMEEQKRQQLHSRPEQMEKIKLEAREFGKNMGSMVQFRQELIAEMAKTEAEVKKKQESVQKASDQEELDDIAQMIKEAAKKGEKG